MADPRAAEIELEKAAALQRSLLPRREFFPGGVAAAWVYLPLHELSGDLCGCHHLGGELFAFHLVDVSGHDVAAAMRGAQISSLLEPSPLHDAPTGTEGLLTRPLDFVRELNARFQVTADCPLYFTMVYAVIDLVDRRCRFVNAGHTDVIHLRPGAAPHLISSTGPAVGVFDATTHWKEGSRVLESGDRLVLVSDGVTEARNGDGESIELEGIIAALGDPPPSEPHELVARIVATADGHRDGQPIEDDRTVLVIAIP